jgi:hypothetical protein
MSLSSLFRPGRKDERLPIETTRYVENQVAKLKLSGLSLFETDQ